MLPLHAPRPPARSLGRSVVRSVVRLRRTGACVVALAALTGGASVAVPVAPATATSTATAAVSQREVAKPSRPVITETRGGDYAVVQFKVQKTGGQKWTHIQARGVRWEDGRQAGSCNPPTIKSSGAYVGFSPGGPGVWSFQVRVKNSAGWSPWSASGKRVRIR